MWTTLNVELYVLTALSLPLETGSYVAEASFELLIPLHVPPTGITALSHPVHVVQGFKSRVSR